MSAEPEDREALPRKESRVAPGSSPEEILTSIARSSSSPLGPGPWTHIRRPRVGSRATVLFLESPVPVAGRTQWVVKRPNLGWVRDDLARPVRARDEFEGLKRLHAHFQAIGGTVRVPEPIALFPDIGVLAMEYVPGRPLSRLLRHQPFRDPGPMLEGMTGTAEFIRQLHSLEELPDAIVNLRTKAEEVLEVADEKLRPLGLSLPRQAVDVLSRVPESLVPTRQVRLHGDYGPTNLLLADDGSVVGIDASLEAIGAPEEDLVRFIVTMSCALRFAPGLVLPATRGVRRQLESQFLRTYYDGAVVPPLLELTLLHQLALRWPRLREFAHRREGRLLPVILQVIGAQVRQLMVESSGRLAEALDRVPRGEPGGV